MQGRIEIVVGGMFSGKSEELIRRVRRAQIAKQPVQVFKPETDNRYSTSAVVSHRQNNVDCVVVKQAEMIHNWMLDNTETQVVAIDEAQFFDEGLIQAVSRLVDLGIRVIVAGLDMDSDGKPFGPIPTLMAMADEVLKLHAVCVCCGRDALFSYHKNKKSQQVEVGADQYEARCRTCWAKGEST